MSTWSVVGEALDASCLLPLSLKSSPPHQPKKKKPLPRCDEMNGGNYFHYSWKKTVSKTEIHIVPFIFLFQWERKGEWGEGGKSVRRTGEAGSGLRWRGGDGTDINPSNACLSVFSSPPFCLAGLWLDKKETQGYFTYQSCALRSHRTYLFWYRQTLFIF